MDANLDELRADVAMICDTNMWDADTPAITTTLRSLCAEEITIHAADSDLHFGLFGCAGANPNNILAGLHDADGRARVPADCNVDFQEHGTPATSPPLLAAEARSP
jgi:acetylornithine deacetylase/succinyl-diaminopimelate desuccinylase-like protein